MSDLTRVGDIAYQRSDKCNSELLVLTYGVLVAQLIRDFEDVEDINAEIEMIGYSIGSRLVDEVLSKAQLTVSCASFKEAMEVVAKVGFKMFLGVNVDLVNWSEDITEVTLCLMKNPMTDFVELPDKTHVGLKYSNIYCGVIRGALEQIRMPVSCKLVKDRLYKNSITNVLTTKDCIRIKLK